MYGAGKKGRRAGAYLKGKGFSVRCFVDRNDSLWGERIPCGSGTIEVWGLERLAREADKENAIVLCTMENALQHEDVAELLHSGGFDHIVFLPVKHSGHERENAALVAVYNDIVMEQLGEPVWLPDYSDLEETESLSLYGRKWRIHNGMLSAWVPVELLYSDVLLDQNPDPGWARLLAKYNDTNVVCRKDYFAFWAYLRTGKGGCEDYLRFQAFLRGRRRVTAAGKRSLLTERRRLLELYDREFESGGGDFFFEYPSEGKVKRMDSGGGFISIRDGFHRVTYLLTRGVLSAPMSLSEEDYRLLGGTIDEAQGIMAEGPRRFIEHPVFEVWDQKTDQSVRRLLFSVLRHQAHFRGAHVLVLARDGGYLLRGLLRSGAKHVISYCDAAEADWARRVTSFFQFDDSCWQIKALPGPRKNLPIDRSQFALLDLTEGRENKILEQILTISSMRAVYLRVMEKEWKKLRNTSRFPIEELERYWLGDGIAVTAVIRLDKRKTGRREEEEPKTKL